MRILFSFAGGNGHFHPLVPIAGAARAAGHTVAVAARPSMGPAVGAAGFDFLPAGTGVGRQRERLPLRAVDVAREDRVLREHYAGRLARDRAAALLAIAGAWRPDLIACDEVDFGAMVAAERLGIPHASVLVIAAGSFVRPEVVAEPLRELRAAQGLPPDPELAMLGRYLVLSPAPPSFRDPAFPLPATAHAIRPAGFDAGADATLPPEVAGLAGAPLVYFTLGTEFNVESGDLFARVLAGLRDLPLNLVVTVGPDIDPAELSPQPPNVHIAQYIPQAALLPRCAAVVSHGGSGSVIGALAHGLPMVVIPLGADQPLNAARCVDLGVARVLDALRATPAGARDAVATVLAEPGYRRAAERMRAEIAALPGPEHAARLLERLAAERLPIISG